MLLGCVLVVAGWEMMARFSRQPFKPFDLTTSDFVGFQPVLNGRPSAWIPVSTNDPAEPNIVTLQATGSGGSRMLVRLVHGYNMPTCMKLKSYDVVQVADWRTGSPERTEAAGRRNTRVPVQVWRLTAPGGSVSLWVSTMLRAGDFCALGEDIRLMAFPRVDTPDDPRWIPQGVTADALRHPVAAVRGWFRARWNSSRTDLLTFLRLRQPAWASEERLSFVTRSLTPDVTPDNEPEVMRELLGTHCQALEAFQQWRRAAPGSR